jgi:hypothetical protein
MQSSFLNEHKVEEPGSLIYQTIWSTTLYDELKGDFVQIQIDFL